jgi:flagellar basal-body rod protein FlgF
VGRLYLRDGDAVRLVRRTDGLFTPFESDAVGEGDIPGDGAGLGVTSGALEGSNASAMGAMVRMIDLSRSFETNIRIIKQTKDLDQQSASMMRLA